MIPNRESDEHVSSQIQGQLVFLIFVVPNIFLLLSKVGPQFLTHPWSPTNSIPMMENGYLCPEFAGGANLWT